MKLDESGELLLLHSVTDPFWGIGIETSDIVHPLDLGLIKGKNHHGILLMNLRESTKSDVTQATRKTVTPQINQPIQPQSQSASSTSCLPLVHNAWSTKPKVLMIGNSLWKNISEKDLSGNCSINKVFIPLVEMALEKIHSFANESYKCICIQLVTNEVRNASMNAKNLAHDCTEKMCTLVNIICEIWPEAQVIISQATPRADKPTWSSIQSLINCNLGIYYTNSQRVSVIDHEEFRQDGVLVKDLYTSDLVHLSAQGSAKLAAKLKFAIHKACNCL